MRIYLSERLFHPCRREGLVRWLTREAILPTKIVLNFLEQLPEDSCCED
jgi:hypothetical protein